jgi:hypothetical protein
MDSNRAGEKRGKQPLWLCKVMCYHVQPGHRQTHRVAHLPAHLLEHPQGQWRGCEGSAGAVAARLHQVTLDVYEQALTPAKRAAQSKVVHMIRAAGQCTASVPRIYGDRV